MDFHAEISEHSSICLVTIEVNYVARFFTFGGAGSFNNIMID